MRALRAAAVVLALAVVACRQSPRPARPPTSKAPAAALLVTPNPVDLGRTAPGGFLQGSVQLAAQGGPVRIVAVTPSCECTAATLPLPVVVLPGRPLVMPVSIDLTKVGEGGLPSATNGARRVERSILIKSDAAGEVEATVVVEVSDQVRITPIQIEFGKLALGATARGTAVVIGGPGAAGPVHVVSVEPSDATLRVAIVPDGAGSTRLDVTWGPLSTLGKVEATAAVALDLASDPRVTMRLVANVVRQVTVTPEKIEALSAPLTRPVETQVLVQRLDGRPVKILGAVTGDHNVQVEVVPGIAASGRVNVLVPVMALPREVRTTLVLSTDAPGGERLEVPIHVRAKG